MSQLALSPFAQWLGLEVTENGVGLTVSEQHIDGSGNVHPGVLCTILSTVAVRVVSETAVSKILIVNVFSPSAKVGDRIIGTSVLADIGRHTSSVTAELLVGERRIATAVLRFLGE